jgi:hypothetical protein
MPSTRALGHGEILKVWWPLAASWLLMALEVPAVSAVIARLAAPEVNLAAFGGLVFPLAILVEAPVLMLLGTSTALSRDHASYRRLRAFTSALGAVLTLIHILVVFTPLYFLVAERVMHAPPETVAPARPALMVMVPYAWAVGYRRLSQGLLIRAERSLTVGIGTAVRLLTDVSLLAAGLIAGSVSGAVVAATALIGGVLAEALYAGVCARPCRARLRCLPASSPPLTLSALLRFFLPLALTSLLSLGANSVISAGMGRMPMPLESLAAWPVVTGIMFCVRSLGVSYNEVVVALAERAGAYVPLRRFTLGLALFTTLGLVVFVLPPARVLWFEGLSGLSPQLAALAQTSIWLALPLPALAAFFSWFQGLVLHSRHTRCVTEAMIVFLVVLVAVLWAGVWWGRTTGLYFGMAAMVIAESGRTGWLWWRSGGARAQASADRAQLLT